MAGLNVSVVSADREVWSGEASMVVARTVEGEIGILSGHEPMLAIIAAGEVRISLPGGEKLTAEAADGFLSVQDDHVQIVAARAALT